MSTIEQNLDMQVRALQAAGVHLTDLHVEKVSASSKARPKLEWALANLRAGDTLVVWKLDRFARSMQDLLKGLQIIQAQGAGFQRLDVHRAAVAAYDKLPPHLALHLHERAAQVDVQRLVRMRAHVGHAHDRRQVEHDLDLMVRGNLIKQVPIHDVARVRFGAVCTKWLRQRRKIHGDHAVTFHRSLEGADWIDLGHPYLGRKCAESLR